MGETLTVEKSNFNPPDEGKIYDAIIEKAETRETPFWEDREDYERVQRGEEPLGKKQKEVNFKFILDDTAGPDHAGKTVFGSTPTTFSTAPDCKLRRWIQEILGISEDLPVDYEVDLDDLIGVSCRIQIGHKAQKDGRLRYFAQEVVRAEPASGLNPGEEPF